MTKVIDCKFNCEGCGIKEAHFYVPVRKEGQDVKDWMDNVFLPAVGNAHYQLSPLCKVKTLTQVAIPMSQKGVGFDPNDK